MIETFFRTVVVGVGQEKTKLNHHKRGDGQACTGFMTSERTIGSQPDAVPAND